jgi:predicted double-glycine peptidase
MPLTRPRLPSDALGVPLVRQQTDFSCGPAALLAILQYWGVDAGASEEDLYAELDTTPSDGTEMGKLADGAKARGLDAVLSASACSLVDLESALRAGGTAVLNIQAHGDDYDDRADGHYVVLVGMDEANVYAMDPSQGYGYLSREALLDRWKDVAGDGEVPVDCGSVVIFGDAAMGSVGDLSDEDVEEIR